MSFYYYLPSLGAGTGTYIMGYSKRRYHAHTTFMVCNECEWYPLGWSGD